MIAWGMGIRNNRDKVDLAHLYNSYCNGMQQGMDGYPVKDKGCLYLIAGPKKYFRATALEFYGVKFSKL